MAHAGQPEAAAEGGIPRRYILPVGAAISTAA
jgi:hypothetical protein